MESGRVMARLITHPKTPSKEQFVKFSAASPERGEVLDLFGNKAQARCIVMAYDYTANGHKLRF